MNNKLKREYLTKVKVISIKKSIVMSFLRLIETCSIWTQQAINIEFFPKRAACKASADRRMTRGG